MFTDDRIFMLLDVQVEMKARVAGHISNCNVSLVSRKLQVSGTLKNNAGIDEVHFQSFLPNDVRELQTSKD